MKRDGDSGLGCRIRVCRGNMVPFCGFHWAENQGTGSNPVLIMERYPKVSLDRTSLMASATLGSCGIQGEAEIGRDRRTVFGIFHNDVAPTNRSEYLQCLFKETNTGFRLLRN